MDNKIDYLIAMMETFKSDAKAKATGTTIITPEVTQHIIDVLQIVADELWDIRDTMTKI